MDYYCRLDEAFDTPLEQTDNSDKIENNKNKITNSVEREHYVNNINPPYKNKNRYPQYHQDLDDYNFKHSNGNQDLYQDLNTLNKT